MDHSTFRSVAMVATLGLAVAGCGETIEGASEDDIEKWITLEGDPGFEVSDIDLVVSENTGTAVEPVWRSRADIEFTLEEDFYKRVGSVGGKSVVEKSADEGDVISGRMILRSKEKSDGSWDIDLLKNDIPWVDGKPGSTMGEYVIAGSPEHDKAIAQARVDAEKAEAEKAAKFAEAKKAFVGAWRSSAPLVYNNSVWTSYNGMQAGYRLVLEPSEGSAGVGTITLFDYANPSDGVTSPVGYNVSEDGEFATVSVSKNVRHANMRDTLSRRTWRLSPDGKMLSRRYSAQLKK